MPHDTKTGEPQVNYQEACKRVRAALKGANRSTTQADIGNVIWPNHRMKSQGAALACAPFTRRMLEDGVLRHDYSTRYGGWLLGHNVALCGERSESERA